MLETRSFRLREYKMTSAPLNYPSVCVLLTESRLEVQLDVRLNSRERSAGLCTPNYVLIILLSTRLNYASV